MRAAAALMVVLMLGASAAEECAMPDTLQFCSAVNWPVPKSTSGFAQDSRAKALYDTVLNTMVMSKGVVLTTRCLVAFR
jgi:hypothetical protein